MIGSLVRTAECAIAAEPTPASFENAARRKPWISGANHTTGNAEAGEGTCEDLAKGPTDLIHVHQNDHQSREHIQNTHERHDLFGDTCDGFQSAHDHRKDDARKYKTCDPSRIISEDTCNLLVRLIGLEHIAPAQRAKNTEDREQNGQDFASGQTKLVKPFGHIVHRAARNGAIFVFVAVFYAQRTFGEFRRHAQKACNDHPEGGARSTDTDRYRHTSNVSKPDRARQSSGKRLKVTDLTRIIGVRVVALYKADRVTEEAKLHKGKIK